MKTPEGISTLNRQTTLQGLSVLAFDVVIIGGGITGAGIALDAAARGLKVLLLEKQDFAGGTSSRSTKLIHGGLRYLKNYEFKLVATAARERHILQRNTPHLVTPEPMLLPVLKDAAYGYWLTKAGLTLYDLLAGVAPTERHRMLSASQARQQEPLLNPEMVTGGGLFYEYRTDDARLTIEVLKTAAAYGATCLNYAEVTGFTFSEKNALTGLICKALPEDRTYKITARCVINAAGPWADQLAKQGRSASVPGLFHTKGIHLVVPHKRLPLKQSVYFDVPGGRMLFAIPRNNITYLGTTDTPYTGPLENPQVEKADVTYLLQLINQMFPTARLTPDDIESSWAGIRPLIYEAGKKPTDISRKDEILISEAGLITVAGGKLTGYRHLAEEVVNKAVALYFPENKLKSETRKIKLTSGNFESPAAVQIYLQNKLTEGNKLGIDPEKIKYLVQTYGLGTDDILAQVSLYQNSPDEPFFRLLKAEIWYSINYEGAVTISDFLIRRTGRLYFERETIPALLPVVTAAFREFLGWNEGETERQTTAFSALYEAATAFKKSTPSQAEMK